MKPIENGTSVPSSDQLTAQAKRLRVAMAEKQTPITQSMALQTAAFSISLSCLMKPLML